MIAGSALDHDETKYDVICKVLDACHVDMDGAVMVGDRAHDVEGAHQHGMPCIGVTYGFGSRDELLAAGAEYIVNSAEDLKALLLK